MTCERTLEGLDAQTFAKSDPPFGPGLDDVAWVQRVETWYTEDHEGVDFVEFRVFDGERRRKTVRVPGY